MKLIDPHEISRPEYTPFFEDMSEIVLPFVDNHHVVTLCADSLERFYKPFYTLQLPGALRDSYFEQRRFPCIS